MWLDCESKYDPIHLNVKWKHHPEIEAMIAIKSWMIHYLKSLFAVDFDDWMFYNLNWIVFIACAG